MTTLLRSVPRVVPPRVRSVPEYSFSSGEEAIELAASAGLTLDQWQQSAVTDILAEDASGKWSAFEAALLVPRQNGKGAVLEAIELAGLFLFGEDLIIHSAHEFKTAQEAFLRILSLVQNTPDLDRKVHRVRTSHGEEGIELKTGKRLRFLARSNGSGRGFSCDRLIYDEAYDLPQETVAASLPTLSARPNPQLIYTSSAALDKSVTLRNVMRRGRREVNDQTGFIPEMDPNLCYLEFSADPKADLDDREQWLLANPATENGRINLEFVAKERSAMSEVAFARERLGILDESKGATVIDLELWDELGDAVAMPMDPVAFAVDVNPDSSYASIAVAGRTADGKTFSQVVDRKRGTGWIVDRVEELIEKWRPTEVVLDAIGPAGTLLPAFSERGIDVGVVSMTQYGQACGAFKALVDDRRFVHNEQPGLRAALESARKRPLGESGLWGWHRRDTTDITPLVAVTLATFAFARSVGEALKPPEDNRVVVFR